MEITSTALPELPTISTRRKLRHVLLSTTCFRCSIGLGSKGHALIKAASRSDVKKVKRLLECGADPNHYAEIRSLRDLMNLKDIMMLFGKTPLRAALYADIEITRLLIKYGANLNLRLPDRSTVLHDAAKMGRPDHIEVLAEHGAKIDTRDEQGRTPLAVALRDTWNIGFDSYKDPVPTLLQKGSLIRNLASGSNAQKTAAELALWMKVWPLSVLFLGFLVHFPASPETKQGNNATLLDSATELHLAAIGSATFKNRLLSGLVSIDGIDLDAKDRLSLTPLEYAAICDETENMRTLIQAGADIHCTDENGLTLLHRAVLANRTDVIKTLIEEGEDINVRITPPTDPTADLPTHSELSDNDERWQPLVIATYSAKARLTPLQLAVLANRKDVITTLLDLKADLCAYAYPAMPLPWMAIRHSDDLYATLVAAGAPIRPGDVSAAAQLSVLRKEEPGKEDRTTRLFMDYVTQCIAAGISVPPMTNYPNSEDMVEKGILAFAGLAERVWLREVSTCVMMVVVTAIFGKEELGFDDEEEEEVVEPPSLSSLEVEPDRGWRRASWDVESVGEGEGVEETGGMSTDAEVFESARAGPTKDVEEEAADSMNGEDPSGVEAGEEESLVRLPS